MIMVKYLKEEEVTIVSRCKMKDLVLLVFLIMVFTLRLVGVINADSLQCEGFSVIVPDGWVKMSNDDLQVHQKNAEALTQKGPPIVYSYGFQLENAVNGVTFPYILISIRTTGRLSEKTLEEMEQLDFGKTVDKLNKDLDSSDLTYSNSKMVYDRKNKMIWLNMDGDLANGGKMRTISGLVPTEKGYIQTIGYCMDEDYQVYKDDYRNIALSVSPDSDLVYKARWSDYLEKNNVGINWLDVIGKGVGAGIGVLMLFLIGHFNKK